MLKPSIAPFGSALRRIPFAAEAQENSEEAKPWFHCRLRQTCNLPMNFLVTPMSAVFLGTQILIQ